MTSELVIFTHSSYSDIWPPVLSHTQAYVKDIIPIRFAADIDVPGYPTYRYNPDNTYPTRLLEVLSQTTSKYVLLVHDIDLIMSFDTTLYPMLIDYMERKNITRFSLEVFPPATSCGDVVGPLGISRITPSCSTRFTTPYDVGPSIWKRDDLVDIMTKHSSETYRSIEQSAIQTTCLSYSFVGICETGSDLLYIIGRQFSSRFAFCHLLVRGEWICPKGQQSYIDFFATFFARWGIDSSKRGYMPYHEGI
jgi:hypothetical protein